MAEFEMYWRGLALVALALSLFHLVGTSNSSVRAQDLPHDLVSDQCAPLVAKYTVRCELTLTAHRTVPSGASAIFTTDPVSNRCFACSTSGDTTLQPTRSKAATNMSVFISFSS
jgi:hypothetical protein